ncbi:MAG: hypothetical protein M1818_008162 [Claussenomyces sp. TS43310]|nr:MAG: hypothetical protein M1818_008162 [Claussenomyces sp. TS43310]
MLFLDKHTTKMSSLDAMTEHVRLTVNAQDELTLNENPESISSGSRPAPPKSMTDKQLPGPPRSENDPPRGPPRHRPTRSEQEAMRARRAERTSGRSRPSETLDIFADPAESPKKRGERRLRRNSESSVLDRNGRPSLDSEDEKKRQERRRRERRHREREREREAGKDPKGKKPDRKLDIIDQLDATSIYGTGLFHHDGPFDACNPHRNKSGSRRAPMQAFPENSLNNVLGGGGPINKRPDHATFLGQNDSEAFRDFSTGGVGGQTYEPYTNSAPKQDKAAPNVQSAAQQVEPVHGDESMGLGTSTFLEGTPASRTAIQRRQTDTVPESGGGLQRKKSLAQKIRGMSNSNNSRRDFGPSSSTNPDGVYSPGSDDQITPRGSRTRSDNNPYFAEYEPNKGDSITIVEPANRPGRARAPSSPGRRGVGDRLERRATADSGGFSDEPKSQGFLSRVKSLKGGPRKPRDGKPSM